jgi:hypothetical protein
MISFIILFYPIYYFVKNDSNHLRKCSDLSQSFRKDMFFDLGLIYRLEINTTELIVDCSVKIPI